MLLTSSPDNESIKKTAENTEKLIAAINSLRETIEVSNKETAKYNELTRIFTIVLIFLALVQLMVGFAQLSFDALEATFPDALIRYGLAFFVAFCITMLCWHFISNFLKRFGFSIKEMTENKNSQIKSNQ